MKEDEDEDDSTEYTNVMPAASQRWAETHSIVSIIPSALKQKWSSLETLLFSLRRHQEDGDDSSGLYSMLSRDLMKI